MAVIFDERGNPFSGHPDHIINQVITDARPSTAVLVNQNSEAVIDLQGHETVLFFLDSAAVVATIVFEGSVDGVNYTNLKSFNRFTDAFVRELVLSGAIGFYITSQTTGFRRVRARLSAYTSGTVTVGMRASQGGEVVTSRPVPSNLAVTATAAVNTGVTLTIPAGGVGLFHYITSIQVSKLYSVVGVASGAGVIHTTTNLPGSPAFTTEQVASAVGTVVRVIDLDLTSNPLRSNVANTATTIISPAQLQTIWRSQVFYYLAA